MKITDCGVIFDDYVSARPNAGYCHFKDASGSTLLIPVTTLVRMYELVKFDLERSGSWETVMKWMEDK